MGTESGNKVKKLFTSLLICACVAGLGAGLVTLSVILKSTTSEAKTVTETPTKRIPNVDVQVLSGQMLNDELTLTGSVEPWEAVVLSSESTGKIEWKGVEEGGPAKKGQELFKIDTDINQARLLQAEAQSKLASQELGRIEHLVKRGAATQQDLDGAVANRDVASSTLRLVQIQLEKSVVRAPFDGVVDRIMLDQEEFVDVGMQLVNLVQTHKVKIKVGIPERDIPNFAVGDAVAVRLDALKDRTFEGTIHLIAPSADIMTHTFTTEIAVDNAEGILKPGMIARATLVRDSHPDSIMIPLFTAILLDDQRVAIVEENGVAQLRPIEVGIVQGSSVQVVSGLAPGDRLIVKGQYDVRPGEPVNVQKVAE